MNMATRQAHHLRIIWFHVAIVSILFIIHGAAATDRVNLVSRKMMVKPLKQHKATVKTIQTEDGDIIDCVDIHKQPAFDHPALINHTIQMMPSDHTEEFEMASNASSAKLKELNVGDCPQGTIPILRTRNNDDMVTENATFTPIIKNVMYVSPGRFYGASGYLNVWDLNEVGPQDKSFGYILIGSKFLDNFFWAGWGVNEPLYGDQKTRFTIFWLAQNSGCYNLNCPGFVRTNSRLYLGAVFERTSTFHGFQAEFKITIYLDRQSNNWWVKYFDIPVGYWPAALFKGFNQAEIINWGGGVALTSHNQGCPMGNGHYPSEGLDGVSAYMSGALVRGDDNKEYEPHKTGFRATNKHCYDAIGLGMGKFGRPGYSFFYGGNGRRPGCYL